MKKCFGWILIMSVILGVFNGVYAEELVDGVISENSTELETAIPPISAGIVEYGSEAETMQSENIDDLNEESMKLLEEETELDEGDQADNSAEESNVELFSAGDTWESKTSLNTERTDCDLAAIGEYLYAVGGMGDRGYLSSIERYNEEDDKWSAVTNVPNMPKGFAVASDDENIYIIGGYRDGNYINEVQVYNTVSGEWSNLPGMLYARDQASALYLDGKIYVFGGRDSMGFINSYEYYSMSDNKWYKVTTGYPESLIRIGAKAVYFGGYICMCGGIDRNYAFCGVDLYSVDNLKETQEMIPDGNEDISIACGADKALVLLNNSNTVYEITAEEGEANLTEVTFEQAVTGVKYPQYIIYNGYLYCVGGYDPSLTDYIADVKKYSVYYGDYTVGEGTITNAVTESGNEITLNAEAGKEYMLFINVNDVKNIDTYTFSIDYPEDSFEIIDTCALTAEKNVSYGECIDEAQIMIVGMSSEGLSFVDYETTNADESITKTVNAVLLRAKSSGQRTITYSMVK